MTTHLPRQVSLRAAVGIAAGTAVVFFAGVYAAHAGPGVANVSPRTVFTISGHLTGVPAGTPNLQYTFHKGTTSCVFPAQDSVDSAGNYTAQINYGSDADAGAGCNQGFFDGSDITVDVAQGSMTIVRGQPINPVPYAQFAANSGSAMAAQTAADGGVLADQIQRTLSATPRTHQVIHSASVANSGGHFRVVSSDPWIQTIDSSAFDASRGILTLRWAPGTFTISSDVETPVCVATPVYEGGSAGVFLEINGATASGIFIVMINPGGGFGDSLSFTIICTGTAGS